MTPWDRIVIVLAVPVLLLAVVLISFTPEIPMEEALD